MYSNNLFLPFSDTYNTKSPINVANSDHFYLRIPTNWSDWINFVIVVWYHEFEAPLVIYSENMEHLNANKQLLQNHLFFKQLILQLSIGFKFEPDTNYNNSDFNFI